MIGFTREEIAVLGSRERFTVRIEKFRKRNDFKKKLYKTNLNLREHILDYREKGLPPTSNIPGWDDNFLKVTNNLKKPIILLHPVIEHHFWWLMHNWAAHFMIGLIPVKLFFDFHDWTSIKLNAH